MSDFLFFKLRISPDFLLYRASIIWEEVSIIAASAIIHDLTLLTRNLNDFSKIPQLHIINPWEPPVGGPQDWIAA
jgi:hypothetical protein